MGEIQSNHEMHTNSAEQIAQGVLQNIVDIGAINDLVKRFLPPETVLDEDAVNTLKYALLREAYKQMENDHILNIKNITNALTASAETIAIAKISELKEERKKFAHNPIHQDGVKKNPATYYQDND